MNQAHFDIFRVLLAKTFVWAIVLSNQSWNSYQVWKWWQLVMSISSKRKKSKRLNANSHLWCHSLQNQRVSAWHLYRNMIVRPSLRNSDHKLVQMSIAKKRECCAAWGRSMISVAAIWKMLMLSLLCFLSLFISQTFIFSSQTFLLKRKCNKFQESIQQILFLIHRNLLWEVLCIENKWLTDYYKFWH